MSVLIRGMEMPKNCFLCPISVLSENRLFCELTSDEVVRAKIDKDCPLIELPQHGRLIDADALNELIDGGYDLDFDEVPETKRELMRMIDDAPTIIEEEGQ